MNLMCVWYRDEVVIKKIMLKTIIALSESMQHLMRLGKQMFTPELILGLP